MQYYLGWEYLLNKIRVPQIFFLKLNLFKIKNVNFFPNICLLNYVSMFHEYIKESREHLIKFFKCHAVVHTHTQAHTKT